MERFASNSQPCDDEELWKLRPLLSASNSHQSPQQQQKRKKRKKRQRHHDNSDMMKSSKLGTFFETTTLHGLPEVWRSQGRGQKFVFLFAFLVCNGASIYGCYKIIEQYIERPVATSYFVQEADTLPLPDITICPFNRFNKVYLDSQNISAPLRDYIDWAFFLMSPKYDFISIRKAVESIKKNGAALEAELGATLERLNMTFLQLVEAASTQCQDIIMKCASRQNSTFNCCAQSDPILTTMGRCFRLGGTVQVGSGFGMGMTVMLRLPYEKYTPSINMPLNDGVMVKLTEPGKGFEYDAIFIPTGVHALLQLRATEMQFMNDPPRYTCLADVDDTYTPLLCYQQCLLVPMENYCNCTYIGVDHKNDPNSNVSVCHPSVLLSCGYQSLIKQYNKNPSFNSDCKAKCKARCKYWQYQSTVSYAKFPSRSLGWPYFSGNTTEEKMKTYERYHRTDIVLEMFYEKLEYTLIKHFPAMTIDTFIANIGGQMGLWMGGSILSFVHLFVFIVLILCTDNDSLACQRGLSGGRNRRESSPDTVRSPDGPVDTDCDESDTPGDRITQQSNSRSDKTEMPQTTATTTYYDWSAKNLNGGGAVFTNPAESNGSVYTSFRV